MRAIDIKRQELLDEFCNSEQLIGIKIGWSAATKASVDIALEILREVLRDETSELTYGAVGEIRNRLHQELDV